MQQPDAREVARLLIRIGVTEHHLEAPAALHDACLQHRVRDHLINEFSGTLQHARRFQQRHDVNLR